jgi:hypothetical protein
VDVSEIPLLQVNGIPKGMKITDGSRWYISSSPSDWFDLTEWEVSKLKLITDQGMPGDYFLTYRLTTTEIDNGSSAVVEQTVYVKVDEVLPQLTEQRVSKSVDLPKVSEPSSSAGGSEAQGASTDIESNKLTQSIPVVPAAISSTVPMEAIQIEPAMMKFEHDPELTREFDTLRNDSIKEMLTLGNGDALGLSSEDRYQESISWVSFTAMESRRLDDAEALEVRADREIGEIQETQIQGQSNIDRAVENSITLQGRVVAFWNMLRGAVLVQETEASLDNRVDVRTSQRSGKQR